MNNKSEDVRGPIDEFLLQSFENMLKELNKKQVKLREIINSSIELFRTPEFCSIIYSNSKETNPEYNKVMRELVSKLKTLCESKQSKIVVLALDCIQKLMVSGSIQGKEEGEGALVDRVVEIVLNCVELPDEAVHLQIVRTISAAVTSPLCDIHEKSLTNSFSKSVNIYLQCKHPSHQSSIKEALYLMLSYLFQQFEEANFSKEKSPEVEKIEANGAHTELKEDDQSVAEIDSNDNISIKENLIEDQQKLENINGIVEEKKEGGEKENHNNEEPIERPRTPPAHIFGDCFLIFRALCKLSQKDLSPTSSVDSVDMKRKLLSLELLQSVIDQAGPALKSNDRFISQAIKKYLVISILNNGVSPFPKVFRLSLNIFNGLLSNFKDSLRNEIGIYFSKILLRILASNNSALQQKHAVLKFLLDVCKNAQTLVDIFLNYDCHLESEDLFESMVNYFAAIAKAYSSDSNIPQENEVSLLALECLVTIMKSQVAWSSELAEEVHHSVEESATSSEESLAHLFSISKQPSSDLNSSPVHIQPEGNEASIDQFKKIKLKKQQLEHGKKLFNLKPKKGIKYLIESGYLPSSSLSVAKFLLQEEGLDKTQVGQYIGDISDTFCISVLYDYVDLQKFSNQSIDTALRNFLSYFRLPGESQKIDKIMEKFAERYFHDNVNANNEQFPFENADAAYIFAFHMIMLATDLHNVAIRKKMSKQEWIRNNMGLNDNKDFPESFLIEIYDSIAANEIKTRDHISAQSYHPSDLLNPKQRQMIFQKESKMVVQQSQDLILEKLQKKSTFFKSNNIQHVKPMFEMCWCPMLAAFSVILETDADDNHVFSLCLEGFKCAIRVSSIFYMETERNAFVTSLCQFTLLSNTREMKQKNIHAIKCLIAIANEDGNYLQDSWSQVLNCISQLAKIHLIGSGAKTFSEFSPSPSEPHIDKSKRTTLAPDHLSSPPKRTDTKLYEGVNAHCVVDQINVDDIDKIYSNTTHLNNNAIVEFVKCMCDVSEMEVNSADPRTFSLQKLVELAYFNMERIRFVWSRIWGIMATHLVKVACHKNLKVAMYAVDSLRQLAVKFLEKEELANYHFQKDFLKPFELIITNNSALQIRELVIRCVSQIILSKSENIKSGWKSMIMVFAFAANDRSEMIATLAYETMMGVIMEKCFHLIKGGFFVECVNCLVSFAKSNHSKEICCKAIESIEFCANQLASGEVAISIPPNDPSNPSADEIKDGEEKFNDGEGHLRYWFPILTGLSQVITHPNVDVRSHALDKLYSILTGHGALFTNGLWKLIFRGVLLPIFDNVNYVGDLQNQENEWLGTTCLKALTYFVELFSLFFDRLQFLLIDFLVLLANCTLTENENLATISCSCLLHFCLTNGARWDTAIWNTFCKTLHYIITNNICHELLSLSQPPSDDDPSYSSSEDDLTSHVTPIEPNDNFEIPHESLEGKLLRATPKKRNPHNLKVIAGKSTVHIELISAIKQIFETHYPLLNSLHLSLFLTSLFDTYSFAHTANNNKDVWKASGIMSIVIKQETVAISVYLQILFTLYNSGEDWKRDLAEEKLTLIVSTLIKDYLDVDDKVAEIPPSYFSSKVPAVCQALQGYSSLKDEQFLGHFGYFYEHFADLFTVAEQSVRIITKDIFLRFGKLNSVI